MKPFIDFKGKVMPLDRINVDTDQIIPKQFLKRIERTGFGQFLFYDWRFNDDGSPNKEFILNNPAYNNCEILLARDNFGSGSSREHAPWALSDYGFKVIISSSFADIFYNNCFKNGMLPITLSSDDINYLFDNAFNKQDYGIEVKLSEELLNDDYGWTAKINIDSYRKKCLVEGLDDIAITLQLMDSIKEFEDNNRTQRI